MLYIRTDANEQIATGHVMRCLSIAGEIRENGSDVTFVMADDNMKQFIEQSGFKTMILGTSWNNMDEEVVKLKAFLEKDSSTNQEKDTVYRDINFNKIAKIKNQPVVLVDSYSITQSYFDELSKFAYVVYLDDFGNYYSNIDCIINYSVYAKDLEYDKKYKGTKTKLYLGMEYVPLRKPFRNIKRKTIYNKIENVLFLTGGADTYHIALNFIKEIIAFQDKRIKKLSYHIVCGRYNVDIDEIKQLSEEYDNIILYPYVEHIEELMMKADLAISAGGSTLYELYACGTPTITYSMADNQLSNVKKFDELNIMNYCGDVRDNSFNVQLFITEIVSRL